MDPLATRRRRALRWGALGLAIAGLATLAYVLFAPEPSIHVDEPAVAGAVLREGRFASDVHEVSGSVRLVRDAAGGHVLRFEGYEALAGPDVFFYLTPAPRADGAHAVEAQGILIPTPTDDGQATLRGNFNVPLPAGVDPAAYQGIAVWCRSYNVLFGHAELHPA